MAALGFRTMDEMIGRVDKLNFRPAVDHWKAKGLDYSSILYSAPSDGPRRHTVAQDHGLADALDNQLIERCREALEHTTPVSVSLPIRNVNRTVGTMLGYHVTKRYGGDGLPDDTIRLSFTGSAGQSFAAFVPRGITLTLEGDSNDYIGKGLSGGKLIVYPPKSSRFVAEDNILIGNVALYGATSGEAYFRGVAGERFAVRNSGALTVVEGVGDHGCEYMTGGRVVVLGRTGRNFAAGMSGGIAYVLDAHEEFQRKCNTEMVDLETLDDPEDVQLVRSLIVRHVQYTGSELGSRVLDSFEALQSMFVKVMPRDFRRVLNAQARAAAAGREATFLELVGVAANG
jgi:glutamate synthase (ferredoxin)